MIVTKPGKYKFVKEFSLLKEGSNIPVNFKEGIEFEIISFSTTSDDKRTSFHIQGFGWVSGEVPVEVVTNYASEEFLDKNESII